MPKPANHIRRLGASDYTEMLWANGLGKTLELARCDDLEGRLLWRCSIADIVHPGPFSIFPGIDRELMLLNGDGFVFETAGQESQRLCQPGSSIKFSGGSVSCASEVYGPSRDVNVMTQEGRYVVTVEYVTSAHEVQAWASDILLVYVDSGAWGVTIDQEETQYLSGETLIFEPSAGCTVTAEGFGRSALVHLRPQ